MNTINTIYDSDQREISVIKNQLDLMDLFQYFEDEDVSDICIQNYGEIQIKRLNGIWNQVKNTAVNQQNCEALKNFLLNFNQKFMDYANSSEALSFPSGERCHIVTEPDCEAGHIIFAIRKYSQKVDTLENYALKGNFDHVVNVSEPLDVTKLKKYQQEIKNSLDNKNYVEFFKLSIKHRLNIILVGAMHSGKTYLHRILLSLVDHNLRIALLQTNKDVVMPNHPNVFHLFYPSNEPEKASKLIRDCLRLSLDLVIIAETGGMEAWDLVQLMSIGHSGIIFTFHANNAKEAFPRLTDLAKSHPVANNLDWNYIHKKIKENIDVSVYMQNHKVSEIYYQPKRNDSGI